MFLFILSIDFLTFFVKFYLIATLIIEIKNDENLVKIEPTVSI
jgi:hypothetical protein